MQRLTTDWWFLDLPNEWHWQRDEDGIELYDDDGVGVMIVTTLSKNDGDVEEQELLEMLDELGLEQDQPEAVSLKGFAGFQQEFQDDDCLVREWVLSAGAVLLLITYECDWDNRHLDRALVDEVMGSLQLIEPESNDT